MYALIKNITFAVRIRMRKIIYWLIVLIIVPLLIESISKSGCHLSFNTICFSLSNYCCWIQNQCPNPSMCTSSTHIRIIILLVLSRHISHARPPQDIISSSFEIDGKSMLAVHKNDVDPPPSVSPATYKQMIVVIHFWVSVDRGEII